MDETTDTAATLIALIKQKRAQLDEALTREVNVRAEIRIHRADIKEARRAFLDAMRSPRKKTAAKPARKRRGSNRRSGTALVERAAESPGQD